MQIWTKRAYEDPGPQDGTRILVDRLWPRGVSREKAAIDVWLKDIAPSDALRKWFGHDPDKWEEFKGRYYCELNTDGNEAVVNLLEKARKGRVTLVFGAKNERFNNAEALKAYVKGKLTAQQKKMKRRE
jgi:uncharacterized protein YeaO (DUF488 family)